MQNDDALAGTLLLEKSSGSLSLQQETGDDGVCHGTSKGREFFTGGLHALGVRVK